MHRFVAAERRRWDRGGANEFGGKAPQTNGALHLIARPYGVLTGLLLVPMQDGLPGWRTFSNFRYNPFDL